MQNSVINYSTTETDNYIVQDYTSKEFYKIVLLEESNSSEYIDYLYLTDNSTIEQLSQSLYGSPDYWDLLLLINGRSPLFDMAYSPEFIFTEAEANINKYNTEFYFGQNLPQDHIDFMVQGNTLELEEINENNRKIKIVRPGKLQGFMRILREKGLV